jgi:hypothetical protein
MTTFTGPPANAIRNKPITRELKQVLDTAAQAAGADKVVITSGGQDVLGEGTRLTGSTRHDRGRAADLQLVINGVTQTFTDQSAPSTILTFVAAAAAAGATGIGAGVQYMGNRTMHVGFGTSINDTSELTWGKDGRSANAPQWLRDACAASWAAPGGSPTAAPGVAAPGRYVVIARGGLKLRGGPGTNFTAERTLPLGTELTVVELSSVDRAWARVDLEGDGLLDGFVFAAFLASASGAADPEHSPEPDDGGNN